MSGGHHSLSFQGGLGGKRFHWICHCLAPKCWFIFSGSWQIWCNHYLQCATCFMLIFVCMGVCLWFKSSYIVLVFLWFITITDINRYQRITPVLWVASEINLYPSSTQSLGLGWWLFLKLWWLSPPPRSNWQLPHCGHTEVSNIQNPDDILLY